MIKNYFILNRLAVELNQQLAGLSIKDFFSQEKDRAVVEFSDGNVSKFIEISVNPGLPFITSKKDYRRAKKNTIDLFLGIIHSSVKEITISDSDRIIKFSLSNSELYFIVRGKHTNIVCISNSGMIESLKKDDEDFIEEFMNEIKSHRFIKGFSSPDFSSVTSSITLETFRKQFPFISKEILLEVKLRTEQELDITALKLFISDLESDSFKVHINKNSSDIKLTFKCFKQFESHESFHFDNLIEALNFFIPAKFRLEKEVSDEKILKKHLDTLTIRLSQKLNKLKTIIDRESREDEYNRTANLLLINIQQIKTGMTEIELTDIYSNNENISIKLDPSKSPRKNIDGYFEKARSEKINRAKSIELYESTQKSFNKIHKYLTEIEKGITSQRNKEIMTELKIKTETRNEEKDDIRTKFKRYVIDNKYFVYVGRDSKNNDLLTLKFAKQNDYWFHARSVPGSHVVLKSDESNEKTPKDIIKRTASLAAFHSKAKTSGMVPVSYTQKKYVVKKKGMEAGKVALLREDVVIVKPEIPKGCEFVESEND